MDGKRVKKPTSNMKCHVKKTHGALHHKIVQEQEKKKAAQKRTTNVSDVTLSKNRDSTSLDGQKKQTILDSFFKQSYTQYPKKSSKKRKICWYFKMELLLTC